MKNCKEVIEFLKDTSIPLSNRINAIRYLYMGDEIGISSKYNSYYWRLKGTSDGLIAFYFDEDNKFRVLCTYDEIALVLTDYDLREIARSLNNLRDNKGKEVNEDQVELVNKFFGQKIFLHRGEDRYYPVILNEEVCTYNEKENENELILNITKLKGDWEL